GSGSGGSGVANTGNTLVNTAPPAAAGAKASTGGSNGRATTRPNIIAGSGSIASTVSSGLTAILSFFCV
ncbi:hypothetical protein HDU98_004639, partial [Podochytrium sp. JEL0797]